MTSRLNDGFTLIELAVALVIIGLVVGGVLAGRDLMRTAELRALTADLGRLDTAIKTFQTKYNCLPGDCPNATTFWGAAGGDGTGKDAACYLTDAAGTTATCNGDGNGIVDGQAYTPSDLVANMGEKFIFWKHLSDAALFKTGPVSGTGVLGGAGLYGSIPGRNVPPTPDGRGGLDVYGNYNLVGDCGVGNQYLSGSDRYSDDLGIGAAMSGAPLWNGVMSPADARSVDEKADDGVPGIGRFRAICPNSCVIGVVTDTATYNTAISGPACVIRWRLLFKG